MVLAIAAALVSIPVPAAYLTSTSPLANSHSVAPDSSVVLNFDADETLAFGGNFVVRGSQTGRYPGSFSGNGSTSVTFAPTARFKPGEQIALSYSGAGSRRVWEFIAATTDGSGEYVDSGQALGAGATVKVVLGDVDGDGDLDFVAANYYGEPNRVWLNNGSGVFNDSGQTIGTSDTAALALGDLDGDGDLDLVEGNMEQPDRVWLNDGSGRFTDSGQELSFTATAAVALGDLDGDGDLDLVVGGFAEGGNRVWLNDGHGIFSETGQTFSLASGGPVFTDALALGDVDGDGDLDLVDGNLFFYQGNPVWLNDGHGVFSSSGQVLGGYATASLVFGDVDGDGDLDLVEGDSYYQGNRVWLNNGSGVFNESGQVLGSADTTSVALGDVDGDGDLDLVVGNFGQSNRVWLNDGTGRFSDGGQSLGSFDTASVALGDVDGDGDLDIVTGNYYQANRVWINQAAVITGSCGAAEGLASRTVPATGLCATGMATAVTSTAAKFSWNCTGSWGGASASCVAPRAYKVSTFATAGGTLNPAQVIVVYDAAATLAVIPDSGYRIDSVSGCGGSLYAGNYTTAPIVADCTVAASFIVSKTFTIPTGGGSAAVEEEGSAVDVVDNGSEGSVITMAQGSSAEVKLPGNYRIEVQSLAASRLEVRRIDVGGQAAWALSAASGNIAVTATQAGQPVVFAGGIGVVSGKQGNTSIVAIDAQGHTNLQAVPGDSLFLATGGQQIDTSVDLAWEGSAVSSEVQIVSEGETIQVAPVGGNARIGFSYVAVGGGSAPVPKVLAGELQVGASSSCAPMLGIGTSLIVAGTADTRINAAHNDGLMVVTASAGQGMIGACSGGSVAAARRIYAGESAEFTGDGVFDRIRLGSLYRDQGWLGDPLTLSGFSGPVLVKAGVASITGVSSRLGEDFAGALLVTLNALTGNIYRYGSEGQNISTGVWVLQSPTPMVNGSLAVWPVGDIVVDEGSDLLRTSANGMVQIRSGNLLASIAPAVIAPQAFAAQVVADGASELIFQADGTLHGVFSNIVYVLQPDWALLQGTATGFYLDAFGRIAWGDGLGHAQLLKPAFANLHRLITTFQAEDPGLMFQYAWRGEVGVVFGGVPMILTPEPFLIHTPAAHAQDPWWLDGSMVYIRYPNYRNNGWTNFSQGFRVRSP